MPSGLTPTERCQRLAAWAATAYARSPSRFAVDLPSGHAVVVREAPAYAETWPEFAGPAFRLVLAIETPTGSTVDLGGLNPFFWPVPDFDSENNKDLLAALTRMAGTVLALAQSRGLVS